ncbi:MAG: hypothetical protein MJZ81_03870 [Bacteroidales bacterium]|nr:hypothetical protein [Bacteroidales bacterium]
MFDYETKLAGIEYKIRLLVEENKRLKEDKLRQIERQEEQKEIIKNQELEINKLKEQNKILKLRNTLEEKGDSAEIKLKINQLIRTIDRSISLLNKID